MTCELLATNFHAGYLTYSCREANIISHIMSHSHHCKWTPENTLLLFDKPLIPRIFEALFPDPLGPPTLELSNRRPWDFMTLASANPGCFEGEDGVLGSFPASCLCYWGAWFMGTGKMYRKPRRFCHSVVGFLRELSYASHQPTQSKAMDMA